MPRRHTADTITDPDLDQLYTELSDLRAGQEQARDIAVRLENELARAEATADPELRRQLDAAIKALSTSETELADARRRIATLEHVARGNKRHVQHLVPELERAVAERDQHAAAVRAECDAIETETYGQHDEDADGMREAVARIRTALAAQPPHQPTDAVAADRATVLLEAADRIETLMDQAYERALSDHEIGYANGLENAMRELRLAADDTTGA